MSKQPQYPFVEFGKIFLPEIGRATDFNPLDYSHEYLLGKLNYLRSLVFSPSSETTFKKHVGNVSLALLKFLDPAEGNLERIVFVQMQARRESELSETPQQHRPFYQIRFSYLKPEYIYSQLQMGRGLYRELVYDQRKYEAFDPHPDALRPMPLRLKNYIREGQKRLIPDAPVIETLISFATLTDPVVRWLTNTLVNVSQNRLISASQCFIVPPDILVSQHSRVLSDGELEIRYIERRIEIFQAVQYLVMPYLGILSFALDYITDQKVNLYLMTSPDPFLMKKLSPEQVHIYSKQSSAAYLDYHETALELVRESEHGLVSEWLYSSRLKALLHEHSALDEAIIYLNAKKKKTEERRVEFLQAHHALLADDLNLIAEEFHLLSDAGHYSLAQSPQTDSVLLQRWLREWLVLQEKHLGVLVKFFLAVPMEKRETEFYRALRLVVRRNSPDVLTQIPASHRNALFTELLKVRDEHFIVKVDNRSSANGESPEMVPIVLDAMLELPETMGALDVIADALKTDHSVFLDVLDSLDHIQKSARFRWLLQAYPDMLWADYAILLWDHVCLPENYQLFVSSSGLFREITEFGRKCLFRFRSHSGEKIPKMANKSIQDEMPLLALNTDHKAIRRAAEQVGAKNPWFAEWWLLNELSYVEPLNLFGDAFENLVGMIDQEVPQFRKTSLGFQYLVERSNPSEKRNLHRACGIDATDSEIEHWNLFFQLLDHWLTRGYAIPKEDIAFLILLLPERSATDGAPTLSSRQKRVEELLAKIVRSGTQEDSIVSLRATDACAWLTKTRGKQRSLYLDQGNDLLYQALLKHKRPGAVLVWELWANERINLAIKSLADWEEHITVGTSLMTNVGPSLSRDNIVKVYERFVKGLSSGNRRLRSEYDWLFNRHLKLIRDTVWELSKKKQAEGYSEDDWVAMLQFWLFLWQYEPDEWVKEQAVILLKTYLPEESPEHLDLLGQRCLKEILAFVNHLVEKKLLPQEELDPLQKRLNVHGEPLQKPSDLGKQVSPAAEKTRPTLPPSESEDTEYREEIKTSPTHQNSHRAETRPTFRPSVSNQMEQAGKNYQTPQIDGKYQGHTGWDAEQSSKKEEKPWMIIVMVVVFLALLVALCAIFFTLPMVREFISHLRILGG